MTERLSWPQRFILFTLILWPAIFPLLRSGYYPSHDGTAHLFQTVELSRMLDEGGQFPIRWAADANFSFGSPIFNFYSPLFFYLAALFHQIGFGYFLSIKLVVAAGFFMAIIGMFLLCREIWGEWGGLIGAVAYIYIPYTFVDVYVRGAYPEFLALALSPWVFWSFLKLAREGSIQFAGLAGFFSAALIFSHNFISTFFLVFLLVTLLVLERENLRKTWKVVFLGLLLGLALSSFFWLPAFFERKYLEGSLTDAVNYRDHFLEVGQLLNSPWGYGPSLPGIEHDGMSFQIGRVQLLLSFLVLLASPFKLSFRQRSVVNFLAVATLVFAFLTLSGSDFLWSHFSLLQFGQFPWRFLGFTALTVSLISGGMAVLLEKEKILVYSLCGLLVILGLGRARPSSYLTSENERVFESTSFANSWVVSGFYPRGLKKAPNHSPLAKLMGEGKVWEEESSATRYQFRINSPRRQTLDLNILYFPGWQVWVDGKRVETAVGDWGNIRFEVVPGDHEIRAKFGRTGLRMVADSISLTSLLVICLAGMYGLFKKIKIYKLILF